MRTLLLMLLCLAMLACDRGSEAPEPAATPTPAPAASASRRATPTGPLIQLALNWKPEPQFGGFYAAQQRDIYAKRGLNVELVPGGSGTPVVQMVIAGKMPYGIASGDEIVIARSKGQDVVALFAVYQTCPQGILVRADRGLLQLSDVFGGGTLAMQRGLPYALHLEKTYGFDKVKVVPYPGGIAGLLASGSDYAQQCFVTSEPILLKQNGVEPRAFLIADSGYNPYTTVLVARGDYVRAHEREARAMILAAREGWDAYLADPVPANEAMMKLNPSMDAATFAQSAEAQRMLILSEDAMTNVGEMSVYRWQLLIEQLLELGVIDKPIPAAEVFLAW